MPPCGGVQFVDNRVEEHETPEGVPALQGGRHRPGRRFELMQENWSPTARLLVGTAGGVLAARGLRGGGLEAGIVGLAGAGLLARAVTNLRMKRLVGVGAGRRAVDVEKTITVDAPVVRVFDLSSGYDNFPRFMSNVREVRDLEMAARTRL